MFDRNENRDVYVNNNKLYRKFLKERGISRFRHLSKMKLNKIVPSDINNLTVIDHIYKTGDSLSKLSHKYYGDVRFWWIIAWFNKKPIDNLYDLGDVVHIPLPIEEVMYYVNKDE